MPQSQLITFRTRRPVSQLGPLYACCGQGTAFQILPCFRNQVTTHCFDRWVRAPSVTCRHMPLRLTCGMHVLHLRGYTPALGHQSFFAHFSGVMLCLVIHPSCNSFLSPSEQVLFLHFADTQYREDMADACKFWAWVSGAPV